MFDGKRSFGAHSGKYLISAGMIDDAKERISRIAGEQGISRNGFFG